MHDRITAQFFCHDLCRIVAVSHQQSLEEPISHSSSRIFLQIHINNLTILTDCPPKIMLLAIDLHEYFSDVEGVAVSTVLSLQASGV